MRYIWPIAPLVSLAVAPVAAESGRYHLNIDARDLTGALAQLSAQAQISITQDGTLPRLAPVRLRGRMTAEDALAQLLGPLGWEAVRVAPQAYRLRPARRRSRRRPSRTCRCPTSSSPAVSATRSCPPFRPRSRSCARCAHRLRWRRSRPAAGRCCACRDTEGTAGAFIWNGRAGRRVSDRHEPSGAG